MVGNGYHEVELGRCRFLPRDAGMLARSWES